MNRTEWLQETLKMRFTEAYSGWEPGRLSQEDAARLLGVCERTFRRYILQYEEAGMEGLVDRRVGKISHRRAPLNEVLALSTAYRAHHEGWTAKHYFTWYRRAGGTRSYTWVKCALQKAGLVAPATKRGAHRKRRDRAPLPGMLLHQDGSTHQWVPDQRWDLILTMDDATSEHYAMRYVEQEGTQSSLQGIETVILAKGLFSALYTDRGSHYWTTPKVGGKVDKRNPTQFGRTMQQLGIEMIAAYSPQARGRSERVFRTHQERLVRELARAGIADMEAANHYLDRQYRPAYNLEFAQPPLQIASAFVPLAGVEVKEMLCEYFERQVRPDNCVLFEGLVLQIPKQPHRCHFVKVAVCVRRYLDNSLSIFHGPRCLARFSALGQLIEEKQAVAT